MKDLISGAKKFLKCDQIRHLYVPQYETLKLEEIYLFMKSKSTCYNYFPIEKEMKKLPKQWIVNVLYTALGDAFGDWVKGRIESRNEKVVKEKNLLIDMDPAVAAAFTNSSAVSLAKGISANLLKLGTKR